MNTFQFHMCLGKTELPLVKYPPKHSKFIYIILSGPFKLTGLFTKLLPLEENMVSLSLKQYW